MGQFAKLIIFLGIFLVGLGVIIYLVSKVPGVGRLPGDIVISRKNFTFYFPLTTSLILSLILSIILYLWARR